MLYQRAADPGHGLAKPFLNKIAVLVESFGAARHGALRRDHMSLTVNQVEDHDQGCRIRINLIPHTVQVTTLKHLRAGASVNLEVDTIARYVERMVSLAGKAQ